ncbi:expressed unknown protein [Seminavis robusta]|uniref:Uncharacterized protein n=1 Tax=Seminavis robusta TaxID=568900 RepID=A0A9N8E8I1_9STRA|nr:expressed unknown protein [Seminavis robusta]|eukprot:Sro663_g183460.1 n/a (1082) ;mRNA; r:9878-13123
MTGGSVLFEEYGDLPGFGDSLGASGFFDTTAEDFWDTTDNTEWAKQEKTDNDEEEEKGQQQDSLLSLQRKPNDSSSPATNGEMSATPEGNKRNSPTTKKKGSAKQQQRRTLNRKAKSLRSVSHKVNQVLSAMDKQEEPQPQQAQQQQQQQQEEEQQPQQQPTQSTTGSRKNQLRRQGKSHSVSDTLGDVAGTSVRAKSGTEISGSSKKQPRTPRGGKKRTSAPPKTALAQLCAGISILADSEESSAVIDVDEAMKRFSPEPPKTRKSRMSNTGTNKNMSQSMRDFSSKESSTGSPTTTEGSKKKRMSRKNKSMSLRQLDYSEAASSSTIPSRRHTVTSGSKQQAKRASTRRQSPKRIASVDAMSSSERTISSRRKSPKRFSSADIMVSASERGSSTRRQSPKRFSSISDALVSDSNRLNNSLTREFTVSDHNATATMSVSEGGKRLRLKVKYSSAKNVGNNNNVGETKENDKKTKKSRASMSVSEGGASRHRLNRKHSSERNLVSKTNSDGSRASSKSGSRSRKSRVGSMMMSVSETGTSRTRFSADDNQQATTDSQPVKVRKSRPSKKMEDVPGLHPIQETPAAQPDTSVSPTAIEAPAKVVPRRARVLRHKSKSMRDLSTTMDSSSSEAASSVSETPTLGVKRSSSFTDLSTLKQEPETQLSTTASSKDSFHSLSLVEALESSSTAASVAEWSSAQSISEGFSHTSTRREKGRALRTTKSAPGAAVGDSTQAPAKVAPRRARVLRHKSKSMRDLSTTINPSPEAAADSGARPSGMKKSSSFTDLFSVKQEPETTSKRRGRPFKHMSLGEALTSSKPSSAAARSSAQTVSEGFTTTRRRERDRVRGSKGLPRKRNSAGSLSVSDFRVSRTSSPFSQTRLSKKGHTSVNEFESKDTSSSNSNNDNNKGIAPLETPRTRKKRLSQATMSLPSLQNFLGASAPLTEDKPETATPSSQTKLGPSLGDKLSKVKDPFSPVDGDDRTCAGMSISTEVSRLTTGSRRRRHSAGYGSVLQTVQAVQHLDTAKLPVIATSQFQRAQTDLMSTEKKAVWVQRRLRALGADEVEQSDSEEGVATSRPTQST